MVVQKYYFFVTYEIFFLINIIFGGHILCRQGIKAMFLGHGLHILQSLICFSVHEFFFFPFALSTFGFFIPIKLIRSFITA